MNKVVYSYGLEEGNEEHSDETFVTLYENEVEIYELVIYHTLEDDDLLRIEFDNLFTNINKAINSFYRDDRVGFRFFAMSMFYKLCTTYSICSSSYEILESKFLKLETKS